VTEPQRPRIAQRASKTFGALAISGCAALACTGQVNGAAVVEDGAASTAGGAPAPLPSSGASASLPLVDVSAPNVVVPFRQLTRHEVERTLHDLLGIDGPIAERLSPESPTGIFTRNAFDPNVSEPAVVAYEELARELYDSFVTSRMRPRLHRTLRSARISPPAQPSHEIDAARALRPELRRLRLWAGPLAHIAGDSSIALLPLSRGGHH
jgi:hypothetical protein